MQDYFKGAVSIGFWGFIAFLFSFFMASGNVAFGLLILIGLLFFLALAHGPHLFAVFWLVGSPTIFGFPNLILRPLPFVTMERLLFVVLAMMVLLKMVFVKDRKTHLISLEIIIISFLSYALISLALNTTQVTMMKDGWLFFQYAMPMLVFIISRRIEWSEQGIKKLLACLTITGVVMTIIGILQTLFGITFFLMDYQSITAGHEERAIGAFSSSHTFVATLFIFFILSLFQFCLYRDSMVRFFFLSAMGLMVIGIILGQTRAPLLGGVIALCIIFFKDKNVRPLLVMGMIVAVFVGGLIFLWKFDFGSLGSRFTNLDSMLGRLKVWALAGNMILDNPLFGVGFGAYSFVLNKSNYLAGIGSLMGFSIVYHAVPHNEFVHVTVLLGVTGLTLFIIILYSLIKLMFSIYDNENISLLRRKLGLYIGAIIFGLLFNSLFSDTYLQDYFWTTTYFLAGLVASVTGSGESPFNKGRAE